MKTRLRSFLERGVSYGLVVVAVAVLVFFQTTVDRRHRASIQQRRDEVNALLGQIEAGKKEKVTRQAQVDSIKKQLVERTAEVTKKFEQLLESAGSYTVFIRQVQAKANTFGITILNSTYDPPSQAPGAPAKYLEFRFTLSVVGAYEQMKHFLWEMENSLGRLVKISRMIITPPICDRDGNMRMSLTLSTYFKP